MEAVNSELYECAPAAQNINELLGIFMCAERPETAANGPRP